jgi:putative redox protein
MPVDSTKRLGNLNFDMIVSGHKLRTDVSERLGGTNEGPEPHDYLEASLAACTAITVQMYANRHGIPLVSSDVKIKITKEGSVNKINRTIEFQGELLTEHQRNSLFAIAEKCPLHNFLTRGAEIQSRLVSAEQYIGL